MWNCALRTFEPLDEDQGEAWKRQTRGKTENKLYTFVDLKGEKSTAELVKIYKEGRGEALLDRLKNDCILEPYLYSRGQGKIITTEDLSNFDKEREIQKVCCALDFVKLSELHYLFCRMTDRHSTVLYLTKVCDQTIICTMIMWGTMFSTWTESSSA